MVEGPITKNLSFEIGARRSWIDAFLPIFTSNNFQLSPVYYDYQAKLHWRASPRDDVDTFIFGSDDVVKLVAKGSSDPTLQAEFDSHTYFHRILARWLHKLRLARDADGDAVDRLRRAVPVQRAARQHARLRRRRDARVQPARRPAPAARAPAAPRRRHRPRRQPLVPVGQRPAARHAARGRRRRRLRRRLRLRQGDARPDHVRAVRRAQLHADQEPAHRAAAAPRDLRLPRLPDLAERLRPRLLPRRAARVRALPDQQVGGGQGGDRRLPPAARSVGVPGLVRQPGAAAAVRLALRHRRRLRSDLVAAHRGRGLLQGSAEPGRARRQPGRSQPDQRGPGARLRRRAPGAAGAVEGLLRLDLVHAVALGPQGSRPTIRGACSSTTRRTS